MVFLFIFFIEPAHAQQSRWWAGYLLFGLETYAYEGVWGDIYTIDPYVPYYHFIAEWVTIILTYNPRQWIQVGYIKDCGRTGAPPNELSYYYEYNSTLGYRVTFLSPGPVNGTWHTYYITHPWVYGESENPREWFFYIDNKWVGFCIVYPYWARDQQASVETTTSRININGSYFKRLSYLAEENQRWFWRRWHTHIRGAYSPYWLVEVSHYELRAYGGG